MMIGGGYLKDHPRTCKWLITTVIVFVPKVWGCGTPSKWPNFMVYKWGLFTTYDTWDDPPSIPISNQPTHHPLPKPHFEDQKISPRLSIIFITCLLPTRYPAITFRYKDMPCRAMNYLEVHRIINNFNDGVFFERKYTIEN